MGITGLLPLLKPVTKDIHIRDLKGLTVGIDTYCWLHKGIYSCSAELCQGIPTDKFIKYCVERVHLLLSHGVKPYLVFDGGYLPAKGGKEEERRVKREANQQRGMQLLREGNASGAHQFFSKAADVTPLMAHNLIQVIKRIPGVRYVVAPYEADAQLGFLARNGHVDAVITEDSDIILFGCTRVVFKLDRDGTGQEVDLREVFSRRNDELDMRGMNEDDLMMLCALSGCDYLPSVPGVGLKKAHRLVSRHKKLPKILRAVKFESAGAFPRGYEADFHRALLTFRHQRAFDPVSRTVVHMTPLPEVLPSAIATAPGEGGGGLRGDNHPLDFLGPPVAQEHGCAVADGEVDPITGEAFAEMAPDGKKDASEVASPKIALSDSAAAALAAWRGGSTPATNGSGSGSSTSGSKKKLSAAQGNNLTKYWGTPLSSQKPLDPAGKGEACGGGGGSGGSGGSGGGDYAGASEGLGSGATSGGGVGCGRGTPVRGAGSRKDVFAVPEVSRNALDSRVASAAASPAAASSCVSPASFYAGVSTSPSPHPDYASDSEDKENRDPLLPHERLKAEDEAPGTSKHFGGGGGRGGGRGGGLRAATSARSDARRKRFRSPLASLAAPANDWSSASSGLGGGGIGGDAVDRRRDSGSDPWGEKFAHPRLDASGETEGMSTEGTGDSVGGSGSGSGGSRLKRRRTLGVGSLAPRGLIRGLDGGASGQRSRSLGGVPGGGAGRAGDNKNDGNDAVGPTERCASNLFDRFAARPLPQPARESKNTPSCGPGVSEGAAEPSERAVTAGSAAERDERDMDLEENKDEDRNEDREVFKAAGLGGGAKTVRGAGGGGRGGALSELSVNSVATRSVVTCREGLGVSPPSPVGKGKGGYGPGQARAMGGSGENVSQTCGRRRGRVQDDVGRGEARAVCGGGDDCSSSSSKCGRNGGDAHGKLCSGRQDKSGGVEGVQDSHGGGDGGGGGDREGPSEHTGSRNKKAAGGGSGDGGKSGGVDGGDLFMRFMYNA